MSVKIASSGGPVEPQTTLTRLTDPADIARVRAFHEQVARNLRWLGEHWADLLPGACGKYVAVANEQAYVAESRLEAEGLARKDHPDEVGMVVQFVRPDVGPRVYGVSRPVGDTLGREEPADDRGRAAKS